MSLISVNNVGKAYFGYKSEWQRFARWFGIPLKPQQENWVLRHIGFDIHKGQAIGIIGQNGAGKSTLLKILTGTLQPTEGEIKINGRISAILELGMGFNPELTGRQNVYHSAGLMGFSREQIDAAIEEIAAFAEIGEYFDEPVRVYSSGMQARVAFAIAAAWRPEVLIVDEALSVGDTYFQHKSFNRIREFQAEGTTLLIVSHDRTAIQSLCNRAILLDKGSVIKDGVPEEVFDFYNAIIAEKGNYSVEIKKIAHGKNQTKSGTGEAGVVDIGLFNSKNELLEFVNVGERVELRIKVKVYRPIEILVLGYSIKDRLGQFIYGTNTWHTDQKIENPVPGKEYLFKIAFSANFGTGSYSIQTALVDSDTHLTKNYEWIDMALVFNLLNFDKTHFVGCCWSEPVILIEEVCA